MIFSQPLLKKRLARHLKGIAPDNFLMQRVGEDIVARLESIKRQFDICAVFGDHFGHTKNALEELQNLDQIISLHNVSSDLPPQFFQDTIGTEEQFPFANESINLTISALTLQYINDLPGALVQIKRALKPDGLFIGAFLGGDTLSELRDALLSAEVAVRGGATPRVHPGVDIRDLGALLQRAGFALPVVDSDKFTATYNSALHLMHDLRSLGLTNILAEGAGITLNRAIVRQLEDIYTERFKAANGRLNATFEIIYMTGWAPHESQQKPLKPGSAKSRLADALKTQEFTIPDK